MTRVRLGWAGGFLIETDSYAIRFDPYGSVGPKVSTFVSHAHNDHIGRLQSRKKIYLTAETSEIIRSIKNIDDHLFTALQLEEGIIIDQVEIIPHNAGHMLGSAQYEVRTPEFTLVYTGDINCRDMFTTKAAKSIACDILVLETTYGNPFYIFPDLTQTSTRIVEWAVNEIQENKIPVFRLYSAGKSQEVMGIFNAFTNIPVVTHDTITAITEIYVKNGVPLHCLNCETEDGREALASGEAVYLTPSESTAGIKRPSVAAATGWALGKHPNSFEAAFPLSSHADFQQLVKYVEEAKPREVLTMHGFKAELANYITRKLGIKARPVPPIDQAVLHEYL